MDMDTLFARLGGIRSVGGGEVAPMTEPEIIGVEEDLGVRLPESYRGFLAIYGAATFNGESADNPYIVFRTVEPLPAHITRTGKALFNAFYGGDSHAHAGYSLRARTHFFRGRMPQSMIPVGDDFGAGQICLGIKGEQTGKVFYWDQANEPLDEEDYLEDYGAPRPPEAMFQNVHLIAESFDDFLRQLEIKSD